MMYLLDEGQIMKTKSPDKPLFSFKICYGKCPKNSNTKVSDKMTHANSADPDQTAPEGAV